MNKNCFKHSVTCQYPILTNLKSYLVYYNIPENASSHIEFCLFLNFLNNRQDSVTGGTVKKTAQEADPHFLNAF